MANELSELFRPKNFCRFFRQKFSKKQHNIFHLRSPRIFRGGLFLTKKCYPQKISANNLRFVRIFKIPHTDKRWNNNSTAKGRRPLLKNKKGESLSVCLRINRKKHEKDQKTTGNRNGILPDGRRPCIRWYHGVLNRYGRRNQYLYRW